MAVWDYLRGIVIAVIFLVVIGGLLFGPFQGALDVVVTDLLRMMGFAQYEASAINSSKALAYASSCTALMNIHTGSAVPQCTGKSIPDCRETAGCQWTAGQCIQSESGSEGSSSVPEPISNAWRGPASPDIEKSCSQAERGRVKFGEVGVECEGLGTDGSCKIYNFELPQDVPKADLSTWITGLGHPKYLLYYEAFPRGPESSWGVHGERLGMIAVATGAVLNVVFYGAGRRIASSADEVDGGVRSFLRTEDEGVGLIRKSRLLADRYTPWSLFAPSTDDLGRMAIRSNIDDMVRRSGAGDAVSPGKIDDAADDVYDFYRTRTISDESPDSIRRQVRNRMEDNGISPDSIEDIGTAEFRETANSIAKNLDTAATIERQGSFAGFDEVADYWRYQRTADSISTGLFTRAGRASADKINSLTRQARRQIDSFRDLPSVRGLSRSEIRERALMLGCRSRVPRLAAMDFAQNALADNENARAISDAFFVGTLSAQTLCPGSDLGGARNELSPRAVKALAGVAIASGWAAQRSLSDSEKYTPPGEGSINSVVLKIPYVSPRKFRMNRYANYYYMNLERTDWFQSNRKSFYLVSPFTTRNVDTENAHIEVSHSGSLSCKKGSGRSNTFRVRTQPTWNNERPDVGEVKTCGGTIEPDCAQFNGISGADEDLCNSFEGCSLKELGGDVEGARAGEVVCTGTIEDAGCTDFSAEMCGTVEGCEMNTVESRASQGYSPPNWKNYIHVKSPVDPSKEEELAKTVVSSQGVGVKTCKAPNTIDVTFWDDDSYEVDSLQVSIENMPANWRTSSGEKIYGYDSSDLDGSVTKAAIVLAGLGLEFLSGPVPSTAILATTGAAEVFLFEEIDVSNAWPEH